MSPELINPQLLGLKRIHPTKSSDCYAFGMVIYETISGHLPFHRYTNPIVLMKILEDERPPREVGFTDSLWEVLELCWVPQPIARPDIEDVLQYLESISQSLEPPFPWINQEVDKGNDCNSVSNSSGMFSHFISIILISVCSVYLCHFLSLCTISTQYIQQCSFQPWC